MVKTRLSCYCRLMGGPMMAHSMAYSMQPVTNQSSYIPATAANWPGMPIYPQMTMSPVNPATSKPSMMDPTTSLLASQLGQMQLAPPAPNVSGLTQLGICYTRFVHARCI